MSNVAISNPPLRTVYVTFPWTCDSVLVISSCPVAVAFCVVFPQVTLEEEYLTLSSWDIILFRHHVPSSYLQGVTELIAISVGHAELRRDSHHQAVKFAAIYSGGDLQVLLPERGICI